MTFSDATALLVIEGIVEAAEIMGEEIEAAAEIAEGEMIATEATMADVDAIDPLGKMLRFNARTYAAVSRAFGVPPQ